MGQGALVPDRLGDNDVTDTEFLLEGVESLFCRWRRHTLIIGQLHRKTKKEPYDGMECRTVLPAIGRGSWPLTLPFDE